ncbi:DUF2062 domain-containing protein [Cytobacillus luteolus]|nr:DUF2062 domain-containing protein [Cytobacillus luteolus]
MIYLGDYMLLSWKRKIKLMLLKLFRLRDNAHSVAIGFTVGLLLNFIPTFGIGPLASAALPKLFRGNSVAGLIGGILLVWAFPLLFYLNIVTGDILFPIKIEEIAIEHGIEETEEVIEAGITIGKAFIVGMIVNMLIAGLLSYITVYLIFKRSRRKVLLLIYKKWNIQKKKSVR